MSKLKVVFIKFYGIIIVVNFFFLVSEVYIVSMLFIGNIVLNKG